MDLFCIDQDPHAEIPIADQLMAIPTIYKSSQCVKVLIESLVCTGWQNMALSALSANPALKAGSFAEGELQHSPKCGSRPPQDPWFDRLWTRQEGLYAMNLQVVVLNPIECPRFTKVQTQSEKWAAEGQNRVRKEAVSTFINEKMEYHGSLPDDDLPFNFYLDLVYRGELNIRKYSGAVVGPGPTYSPIRNAWRSARKTTKACDYVLAVLPDIKGYRVPPKA